MSSGGNGKDRKNGTEAGDTLYGGNGKDILRGLAGDDSLFGENGSDVLEGGAGDDLLRGGNGRDTAVYAGALSDYRFVRRADGSVQVIDTRGAAGDGTDTLYDVELFQFSGQVIDADRLPFDAVATANPGGGLTVMLADASVLTEALGSDGIDDVVFSGTDTVVLPDNIENVTLTGDAPSSAVGNALANTMTGNAAANVLDAGDGDDTVYAQGGNDTVLAGAGDDTLIAGGGEGDDQYDGGDGSDTITFTSTTLGVTVNLAAGVADGPEIGHDTIAGVENVVGGAGDDHITVDAQANELTGGAGSDTFAGTFADLNGDSILDFGPGDRIVLRGVALDESLMSRRHWEGNTRLEIWDESTQSVITLGGRVEGALTASVVGDDTVITIGPNGTGGLIDFDGGVRLNGNEYVQNGFIVSTLNLRIEDSFTADGPDAELTASRSGATLRADWTGETAFSVAGFSAGLVNPDGGGFILMDATYLDDTRVGWHSEDGGQTWTDAAGAPVANVFDALTGLRFLDFRGTNWWVDDVVLA
jgi:Ca2+-binding RTX toxin-like protein